MEVRLNGFQILIFWTLQIGVVSSERGEYLGCFNFQIDNVLNSHTGQSVDLCLSACEQLYYRYAVIGNDSNCFCGNTPGLFKLPLESCNKTCPKNDTQKCGGENSAASVYDTEVTTPGPPSSLQVINFTEITVRIRWEPPQAYTMISGYRIFAHIVETYADFVIPPLEWRVSNETLHTELLNLQPGSMYSVSVVAMNENEEGPEATVKVETEIGIPSRVPPDVKLKGRHGDRLVIHIPKAINDNGPVSRYRIIVSIEVYQQGYIVDTLSNYSYAQEHGLPYYITAEIDPEDIKNDFIVGDRSTYNGYYNAPLPLTNDIELFLGIVSEKNNIWKVRYAEPAKKVILNVNELEETSPVVVALGSAIAICIVLLLIGVGLIIILRKRVQFARLQRGSQSMPLRLSEPCIEIENSGFLQEDEIRVDYYSDLKRKLWNIPRNLIDIDISCIVGIGSYGKFTKGRVQQHGDGTVGLIQVISDTEMEKPDKRLMLQELDLLIKSSEHENVISLIGICETNTTLFVVLQDFKCNFKEFLIQSRQRDMQNNKFCTVNENKVLQISNDVIRGMEYLHRQKILHKKLSCRNIILSESGSAKVSGFGLSHIRPMNETPDYTRWTSHEMLRQSRFNPKADVWSFGCLLWEALTVGGTPYSSTANKDVITRVLRGMRPSQPSYVSDDLFHLCLQCWQVDPDERPTFSSLVQEFSQFTQMPGTKSLSFTHINGFEFEPYVHQYEVK